MKHARAYIDRIWLKYHILKNISSNYLMCPPLSSFHRNIKINITDNRHFTLVYLLGTTRLTLTRSTAQEPSIFEYMQYWKPNTIKELPWLVATLKKLNGHP